MPTIRIVNKLEAQQANIYGKTVTLERHGVTEVDVADWLELKKIFCIQIENGFIHSESEDSEKIEIKHFLENLHANFEFLGVPTVKIAMESGALSTGVKKLEASEWLLRKEYEYASETQAIAREANSIAHKAESNGVKQARWAKWAVVIAVISLIISVKDLIAEAIGSAL